MIERPTSKNAALAGWVLLILGMVVLIYAEIETETNPFSSVNKLWNNWHYLSIGVFSFSAASFIVWYWFADRGD